MRWRGLGGVPLVAGARDVFVYFHNEWKPSDDEPPPSAEAEGDSTPPTPADVSQPEEAD